MRNGWGWDRGPAVWRVSGGDGKVLRAARPALMLQVASPEKSRVPVPAKPELVPCSLAVLRLQDLMPSGSH